MAAPEDLTTGRPENPQDCADDHEQYPDRPQDRDANQESDKHQHEPNDDHDVTLPSLDSIQDMRCPYPAERTTNQPSG
jgi:hypothetical protein